MLSKLLPEDFHWRVEGSPKIRVKACRDLFLIQVILQENHIPLVKIPADSLHMGLRLEVLLRFCEAAAKVLQKTNPNQEFSVQIHDEAPLQKCFRFDAPIREDGLGPLIPDPYCLMTWGYQGLQKAFEKKKLPHWQDRLNLAFWRGSTTGSNDLRLETLGKNLRYRLCLKSLQKPFQLDAKFNAIVQCNNDLNKKAIEKLLWQQELLSTRVEPWDAALHRWLIDIDGNVNSWGLLWKLLSGSCVIRVLSKRQQWFHHQLVAWINYIPVNDDLSNLDDILEWCNSHPIKCEEIGLKGRELAIKVINNLEIDMLHACNIYTEKWIHS